MASVTPQIAQEMTDGELAEQIGILRDYLAKQNKSTPETDAAQQNLDILLADQTRRSIAGQQKGSGVYRCPESLRATASAGIKAAWATTRSGLYTPARN